jgi:hypothetical protein
LTGSTSPSWTTCNRTGTANYPPRVVAPDLAACEAFLRGRLTHVPGVRPIESAMALTQVVQRTKPPLRNTGR